MADGKLDSDQENPAHEKPETPEAFVTTYAEYFEKSSRRGATSENAHRDALLLATKALGIPLDHLLRSLEEKSEFFKTSKLLQDLRIACQEITAKKISLREVEKITGLNRKFLARLGIKSSHPIGWRKLDAEKLEIADRALARGASLRSASRLAGISNHQTLTAHGRRSKRPMLKEEQLAKKLRAAETLSEMGASQRHIASTLQVDRSLLRRHKVGVKKVREPS
ncbi:MAG: hypothetical protein AB7H77_00665 [Bdellovibrionales bacterium]